MGMEMDNQIHESNKARSLQISPYLPDSPRHTFPLRTIAVYLHRNSGTSISVSFGEFRSVDACTKNTLKGTDRGQ
ncbi:hypothetical protein KP509_04G028700 [Ceratopteris richardii]|uniref:Uncharacterized protein n=1 Tax=Ceratopteris richardii TaxID=49495 RepID=A0A8T2UR89_CERRI|nr:hypothetical protein KP509_04G028700 [Ceratopteris richardii]